MKCSISKQVIRQIKSSMNHSVHPNCIRIQIAKQTALSTKKIISHFYPFLIFFVLYTGLLSPIWSKPLSKSFRSGKDFALFFAVDQYPDNPKWGNLNNPIKDANAIAEVLETYYGFQTDIHKNPKKGEIRSAIQQWQERSFDEDAQLFIFFSGHGTISSFDDQGYFIPQDGIDMDHYFSLRELRKAVSQIPCNHISLIIDACYSGAILEAQLSGGAHSPKIKNRKNISSVIQAQLASPSRLVLTSGGKERTPDGTNHSPLTEKILKALREPVKADASPPLVYWANIVSSTKLLHPKPRSGSFEGHENGGFVFVLNSKLPSEEPDIQSAYIKAFECGTKACLASFIKAYKRSTHPLVENARMQLSLIKGKDLPNGLVYIRGGSFSMKDQIRSQSVTVNDFLVGKSEVSFNEYAVFCHAYRRSLPKMEPSQDGDDPVVNIDWYDAIEYCNWLSLEEGLVPVFSINRQRKDKNYIGYGNKRWEVTINWDANGYRLPTEAEWEYASQLGVKAVKDMSGKVWEWCMDWHDGYDYLGSKLNPHGPPKGRSKVVRGGIWRLSAGNTHTVKRSGWDVDRKQPTLGFRVVRSL